jgi:hypothetical protein
LLQTESLGKGSQVLKRVYDLTTLSALPQPMELATLLAALKKRLVRLGFAALERVRGERQREGEGEEGEFREAVAQLIRYLAVDSDSRRKPFRSCSTRYAGYASPTYPSTA